jgi:hypothetical protein
LRKSKKNGCEIQDGRQTSIFNNSVSFNATQLKLNIFKENSLKNTLFQNRGLIQDGAINHCFILIDFMWSVFNQLNPLWTC